MIIALPPSGLTLVPGKLLCIGRNYAEHVREMGDVADLPTEPVVFLKPASALVASGGAVCIPPQSEDVHHELELVAVIGRGGKGIPEERALEHVAAYALGLDMTARDLQKKAKESRAPWAVAKGFDTFAPLGPLTAAAEVPDPQALDLRLTVNGELRQHGSTRDMIFPVAFLVSYLSRIFTLEPGDLIYTGTPEGVGPVAAGDVLEATASGPGGRRFEPLRVSVR
jgi:2-keto-4-pentenoate hydratase/2-oxohepta-3-ene-1,7-dioic acid hydratase in catechol pathway